MVRRGAWWAAVAAVLAATACSRGSASDSFAEVAVIERDAETRTGGASDFAPAQDGADLDVGDDVRTDDTGFAEVEYADGSLTRLGADTEFRVVELAGTATIPEVKAELDAGRTWNRVRQVTGSEGSFEVDTPVGTAAVRGTGFAITCPEDGGSCTFDVTEGEVAVDTESGEVIVGEGERVELAEDGTELERGVVDTDDEWIAANLPRDDALGRFGHLQGDCSITVNGTNIARTSASDPLVVSIDDTLVVDAAATGPVDDYAVDAMFGPLPVRAASAEVDGDRWEADIPVAPNATWGVGLYEVVAHTSGTDCSLRAFIQVVGEDPLRTPVGLGGLLALILGLLAVAYAWWRARMAKRKGTA